jgi:hypothetical protein
MVVVVVCQNDMPINTWSIASSKCVMFFIMTLYVNSSDCLTNSFMALTFSLDFLVALFTIALVVVMSSLLSVSLSSYSSLQKKISSMIVLTMSTKMTNSIEFTVRSMCWCKVLMRFWRILKSLVEPT